MATSEQRGGGSTSESLVGAWNLDGALVAKADSRALEIPSNRGGLKSAMLVADFGLPVDECQPCQTVDPLSPHDAHSSTVIGKRRPNRTLEQGPLDFPDPGTIVGGFRLITELGRGAFARVFLAEQAQLANRQVALKVSEAWGDEPQALARLQHAHIVPIHSVHDDRDTGFRLLCMPYLGGANLAQVLELASHAHVSKSEGRSLVEALNSLECDPRAKTAFPAPNESDSMLNTARSGWSGAATRGASPSRVRSALGRYLARLSSNKRPQVKDEASSESTSKGNSQQPARRFYGANSFVRTSVWIVARLAEALEHAHARGILHRDLKPSNILIAADGTPMLLDFNLSEQAQTDTNDKGPRARVGGTLPYMSPEHLDAFNPSGTTSASQVDEQSDVYSLGLIFYEMLAGHHPYSDPEPSMPLDETLRTMIEERRAGLPPIRRANPAVPPSLAAVLGRCLAFEPQARYRSAAELAEDLRRFLDDLPMKHAPEPSLRERSAKWLRRHPEFRGSTSVGGVALALFLALGTLVWLIADRLEAASALLHRDRFDSIFQKTQVLLNTTNGPHSHLPQGLELANSALACYGIDEAGLASNWATQPKIRRLSTPERRALCEQLSELLMLRARVQVRLASGVGAAAKLSALKAGVSSLRLAEQIDPDPPAALFHDRASYEAALGWTYQAEADRRQGAQIGLGGARDYYLFGTALAATGRNEEAARYLSLATDLDNRQFWAWFVLGLCHYDLGNYAEAASDFSICTVLTPTFAWPHLNRGMALMAAGRHSEALACVSRALALSPEFIEARVNRALIWLQLDKPQQAVNDMEQVLGGPSVEGSHLATYAEALSRAGRIEDAGRVLDDALKKTSRDPTLLVTRGLLRLRLGDRPRAREDFASALKLAPANARAHLGMAFWLREANTEQALLHADSSLAVDPNLFEALELRALIRARRGDPSAEADVDRLITQPTPTHLYNAGCALALLSQNSNDQRLRSRAAALVRRACESGFPRDYARNDPDLATIKEDPSLKKLLDDHS